VLLLSHSPARVSLQGIFYTFYEFPLFLFDCGSRQVGRGGFLVLMSGFLMCYKEGFTLVFFCQSSMAMQQGSDDPAWRVYARVV